MTLDSYQGPQLALEEVSALRPTDLIVRDPKGLPRYLRANLDREVKGEQHFVKFLPGKIQVDNAFVPFPTSLEGLKNFLTDITPGYFQAFHREEKKLYESILSRSQNSDLKETGECSLGGGEILRQVGSNCLAYQKPLGETHRNYTLNNVVPLNSGEEVPDDQVVQSPLRLAAKLEDSGLFLPNMISLGSIARGIILAEAPDAYFSLWSLEEDKLAAFYNSIKGPSFRSIVLGDSPNTVSSDLVMCYAHILKSTPSPSPSFNTYIWDTDYHPEASFAACQIWVNMEKLEVIPLGVRIASMLWEEGEGFAVLPEVQVHMTYPFGYIKKVNVNLPTLWFLIEKLGLKLGTDLGIVRGLWVIPSGAPIFAFREWTRKIMKALIQFPDLKYLYQMGPTGGNYRKGTKIGEFQYKYENQAYASENPVVLSHLFDMTRILVLLGTSQCRGIKGIAADGWVSKKCNLDQIGPYKIGAISYGPFPVRNTPLELYYQFDPLRHDEIISLETQREAFWRSRAEKFSDKAEMSYTVNYHTDYGEEVSYDFQYAPSMGDIIPEKEIQVCGDTLGTEIIGSPPHVSQVHERSKYCREPQVGRAQYA